MAWFIKPKTPTRHYMTPRQEGYYAAISGGSITMNERYGKEFIEWKLGWYEGYFDRKNGLVPLKAVFEPVVDVTQGASL